MIPTMFVIQVQHRIHDHCLLKNGNADGILNKQDFTS